MSRQVHRHYSIPRPGTGASNRFPLYRGYAYGLRSGTHRVLLVFWEPWAPALILGSLPFQSMAPKAAHNYIVIIAGPPGSDIKRGIFFLP